MARIYLADKETLDSTHANTNAILAALEESGGEHKKAVRYGIKINKSDSGKKSRVTYLYDAVGMTPAAMNYTDGTFNYGSWGNVEFVKNNYPCMVKFDGTEDYKLLATNYALKADGTTASDAANVDYAGNAMAAFMGGWLCQYETATDEYIIWSNVKYDAEYNAYHRTGKDGTLNAGFYRHIYTPSLVENVARSLSGCQTIGDMTAEQENEACKANGDKWGMSSWWEWNYIICLLKIMAKTDDLQTAYGIGNSRTGQPATTGTLNDKGQFYGTSDFRTQVKVFHTEALWGDKWERLTKLICADGIVKVLPYGEPNFTGEGYTDVYRYMWNDWRYGYVDKTVMTPYGRLPISFNGTSHKYAADGGAVDTEIVAVPLVGGLCRGGLSCGACVSLGNAAGVAGWHFAPGLSCEMPAAAEQ